MSFFRARKRGLPDRSTSFFSGNLTRRKGAHWLPDIAEGLNEDILIRYTSGLRGGTGLQPRHAKTVDLGRIAHQDMPALYRSCDILVSPTVREGFGLAIAEAMASGLPVGGIRLFGRFRSSSMTKGRFLCPVGNVQAFADRINLLAQSPRLRKEMGGIQPSESGKDVYPGTHGPGISGAVCIAAVMSCLRESKSFGIRSTTYWRHDPQE